MSGVATLQRGLPGGRRGARPARRREAVLWALAALALDGVVALAVVDARFTRLLGLGLALVALALVFRFPFAAACGFLVVVAGIFMPGTWKVGVGPLEIRLEELLLGALLVVAVVRPRRAWWGGTPGAALAVFLGVLVAAAAFAILVGRVQWSDAYAYCRLLAPLALFWVAVRLFPTARQMRALLLAAAAVVALTGVVSIAVAAPGSGLGAALASDGTNTIVAVEGSDINRVRLAGVYLAYGLFGLLLVRALAAGTPRRLLWAVLLAGCLVCLLLSFNRNMWVGAVLAAIGLAIFAGPRVRAGLAGCFAALVAAVALLALADIRVPSDSPLQPIVARAETLTDPQREAAGSSLQDRARENAAALATIGQYPLTGVGPGAPFGLRATVEARPGVLERVDSRFLHNQYLWLLLMGGPLLLGAFLAFVGAPVLALARDRGRTDEEIGLAVGVAAILLSAVVTILFVDATGAATIALLVAALTVLAAERRDAAQVFAGR